MAVSEMEAGVGVGDVNPNPTKVQLVNRKSSEELLRKFADPDDEKPPTKPRKRMKATKPPLNDDTDTVVGLVERKRLLPPVAKRRSLFLRHLPMPRSHLMRNKSLFVPTIRKTWRRTVEGASRVFIEMHYNSHRRLISDVVV